MTIHYMKTGDEFTLADDTKLKIESITIHMPTQSPRVTYFHDAGLGLTAVDTVTIARLFALFPELKKLYKV